MQFLNTLCISYLDISRKYIFLAAMQGVCAIVKYQRKFQIQDQRHNYFFFLTVTMAGLHQPEHFIDQTAVHIMGD
jgi:hypothetical protein